MEDSRIIDLFWARDEAAIGQTDAAYGRRLQALANRILNNREDAEESVSDTYLKLWEIIPPQRPNHFYGFIASICRHLSLHKVNWNLAAKRNAEIVALTEEMELCIPDLSRERQLEAQELGRLLNEFLGTLNEESRNIFMRRYWFADSVAEIAQRYRIGESKVKTRLFRARNQLRSFLEKEGYAL